MRVCRVPATYVSQAPPTSLQPTRGGPTWVGVLVLRRPTREETYFFENGERGGSLVLPDFDQLAAHVGPESEELVLRLVGVDHAFIGSGIHEGEAFLGVPRIQRLVM